MDHPYLVDPNMLLSKDMTLACYLWFLVCHKGQYLDHSFLSIMSHLSFLLGVSWADDIALYRIIKSAADYVQLQTDIDSISSFISGKHLKFNAKKCRQMLVSRKTVHSLPSVTLTIDGTPLTLVYLGVTIASWNSHIKNICDKAES